MTRNEVKRYKLPEQADPTKPQEVATKAYVDNAIVQTLQETLSILDLDRPGKKIEAYFAGGTALKDTNVLDILDVSGSSIVAAPNGINRGRELFAGVLAGNYSYWGQQDVKQFNGHKFLMVLISKIHTVTTEAFMGVSDGLDIFANATGRVGLYYKAPGATPTNFMLAVNNGLGAAILLDSGILNDDGIHNWKIATNGTTCILYHWQNNQWEQVVNTSTADPPSTACQVTLGVKTVTPGQLSEIEMIYCMCKDETNA